MPARSFAPRLLAALLATTALTCLARPGDAQAQAMPGAALPAGGQVAAGSVSIGTPQGGALTITQSSPNAIVNWHSFSIGTGNRVEIRQPDAQSAILNRVTGSTPSTIAGQLDANGQVYLVNPNGVAIAPTGRVSAAGFVASSLDIADGDFLAGKRQFRGSGASAPVTNAGTITIRRGGYAALIGGEVENSGTITVPMGRVGLGSGERATLDLAGDGFLQVAVPTKAAGSGALVRHSGVIAAEGGAVTLKAAAARDMARQAVNLSGVIEARGVTGRNGSIVLSGGDGTVAIGPRARLDVSGAGAAEGGRIRVRGRHVTVAGTLDASGARGGRIALRATEGLALTGTLSAQGRAGTGGRVTATAPDMALRLARIDVSGEAGGGVVRLGGGRQGAGRLAHAQTLTVDAGTEIRADATQAGTGGDVVVWSDASTRFSGTISARGGALGGDGGQAEVSSKGVLAYEGRTDLSAAQGAFGTLLLDPYNITISTAPSRTAPNTNGTFTAGANDSVINTSTLQSALGLANVTVTTGGAGSPGAQAGDITVANALAWSAATTLTLQAYHSIAVNAPISVNGRGGLALKTNNGGTGGTLSFAPGANVTFAPNQSGQSLTIDGQAYTLIRSMTELDGIDGIAASNRGIAAQADGLSGRYALAQGLDASNTTYTDALVGTNSSFSNTTQFTGTFEGLGNTIFGLKVNKSTDYAGLFGFIGTGGVVRDLALTGLTVSGRGTVGGLAGQNFGTVTNASVVGAVSGTSDYVGGLVGKSDGTLAQVSATGTATSTGQYVGGLAGSINAGSVTQANAAVAVTGSNYVGGLIGGNFGSLTRASAIGSVTGSGQFAGGLIGYNRAAVSQVFATGSVWSSGSDVGGLVGSNSSGGGTINEAYAIGVVVGGANLGGLIGSNTGSVANAYWNTETTGRGTSASGAGRTTAQLQGGTLPTGFSASVWSTASGLYPYLTEFFPSGVQAIKGSVVTSGGPPAMGARAGLYAGGQLLTGTPASVGANGAFYAIVPKDTLPTTNVTIGATLAPAGTSPITGRYYLDGAGFVGNQLTLGTAILDRDVRQTTSSSQSILDSRLTSTFGWSLKQNVIDPALVNTPVTITAKGTSFSLESGLTRPSVTITTDANYDLTIGGTTTLKGGGILDLRAGKSLTIYGTVDAWGAVDARLTYDATKPDPLSFGSSGRLTFRNADGSPATALTAGQALTINGSPYTLVFTPAQLDAIDGVNAAAGTAVATHGPGLAGRYAIATPFSAAGTTYADALIGTNSSNSAATRFSGTLEGLGNSITDLTVTKSGDVAGLVGYLATGGVVRDMRLQAGVTGAASVGGLVGINDGGTIIHARVSNSVIGTAQVGGVVGANRSGTLVDVAFSGAVAGSVQDIGGVAGFNQGAISSSAASGWVVGGASSVGGLVGTNAGVPGNVGTITSAASSSNVAGASGIGGLVGANAGTVSASSATGGASGSGTQVGGLVGTNTGYVTGSSASGAVTGTGARVGGLVGENAGRLLFTYASGRVDGSDRVGGLVGFNSGSVEAGYAIGRVAGTTGVGGLVGENAGTVSMAYATGYLAGTGAVGGLVGLNQGTLSQTYWDTEASGRLAGIGLDSNNQGAKVLGLTSPQLLGLAPLADQSRFAVARQLGDGQNSAFGGGSDGVYPYLYNFFSAGTQAISGIAYSDRGLTPLADNSVSILVNGLATRVATGANGFYYLAAPFGLAGSSVIASTGSSNLVTGATLLTPAGTTPRVDIWGGTAIAPTTATSLSAAPATVSALLAPNQSLLSWANVYDPNLAAGVRALARTGYIATGLAGFAVDAPVAPDGLYVRTMAGPLTVTAPQVLSGPALALDAASALRINAPVTVQGAGSVNLTYDTRDTGNLSFARGASLTFANADGTPAAAPVSGQALTINRQAYTLIRSMADLDGIDGAAAVAGGPITSQVAAGGLSGRYAVAQDLTARGTTYTDPLVATNGANLTTGGFTGLFEGLGHTLTGLTIDNPSSAPGASSAGLFGLISFGGLVRDIGLVDASIRSAGSMAGPLAGWNSGGTIESAFASGTVTGGTAGVSNFYAGGLLGYNAQNGVVVRSSSSATVTGATAVGGLVGANNQGGKITLSFATGAATGNSSVGGLAGFNSGTLTAIGQSFATGAVRALGANGAFAGAGGLVGANSSDATITQAYASGPVTGGGQPAGGLVGTNRSAITQAYATGAVSGTGLLGGLVGANTSTGTITAGAFDTQTTGLSAGIGQDGNNQGGVAARTTAQLQGGGLGAIGLSAGIWGGAASGLYPYLTGFFPNGVQAVSGTVYKDAGTAPAASGAAGTVTVTLDAGGALVGQAATGANGTYYIALPAGTLGTGASLLASTPADAATGAAAAASFAIGTGGTVRTGFDLYGTLLTVATGVERLSQVPDLAVLKPAAILAAGSDAAAAAVVAATTGAGYLTTGSSFTLDQPVATANSLLVKTAPGASLTVASPVTIESGGSLGLLSGGALQVNAPMTAKGGVGIALAYDVGNPANLAFGNGTSLSFVQADGTAAAGPVSGQALTINGRAYALVHAVTALPGLDGQSGDYALAIDLAAPRTAYAGAVIGTFSGTLEGLGHAITDLTIDAPGISTVGLIGQLSGGAVRNLNLTGGSVRGGDSVGPLAGSASETLISRVTATGRVSGGSFVGGLIGMADSLTISQSKATGTVTGTSDVGGLVGIHLSTLGSSRITQSVASGAVSGTSEVGGLAGFSQGRIEQSYATGAVTGLDSVGGLVGKTSMNQDRGDIDRSYATGAVAGTGGAIGGLVGSLNLTTVSQSYAIGAVAGSLMTGGLVGSSYGTVTSSAWNTQTSGQSQGIGYNYTASSPTGLTTDQFQGGALPAGFSAASWSTGPGLYPYLTSHFPNGVQAVKGTAYRDAGATLLVSPSGATADPGRPGLVSLAAGGVALGTATTGADGSYYVLVPAGTLPAGTRLVAYTRADAGLGGSGAGDAATFVTATGTPFMPGVDLSGGWRVDAPATAGTLSALNAVDAAAAGTLLTGIAPGSWRIAATDLALDAPVTLPGTLAIDDAGTLTQSQPLAVGALWLTGGGTYRLDGAGNTIGTLAAKAGSLRIATAGDLRVGRVVDAMGKARTGVTASGAVSLAAGGSLTLAAGSAVSGQDPVLAAGGAFVNEAGRNAVTATSGRWLIYSAAPAGNTFGGLDSGATAVWNTAAGDAVAPEGNRYVFALSPTLTITSASHTKTYGNDIAAALAGIYLVGSSDSGVTGAYQADNLARAFTGAPVITSAGAAAGAGVQGSPYATTVAAGTLASPLGYSFAFVNAGTVTVNPRAITLTAQAQSRLYGDANPALTYAVGGQGLANGDTLSGSLATAATARSDVGTYAIGQGTLAASANYAVTYQGADLTVTARPLTLTAQAQNRLYGDANPALTYAVGGQGLANGDTLSGGLATVATSRSNVGTYAIGQGTLAASANYAVTYQGADLTVAARPLTLTAQAQNRLYGDANPALTYAIGGQGLANGDTLSGGLATVATSRSDIGTYAIGQGTLAASANYAVTYQAADLTVAARPLTVTADAHRRTYGEVNPALTYTVGGLGLVNGDMLSGGLATAATARSDVGAYAIGQGTLAASANYAVTYQGADLAVTARPLTVTADAHRRTYGDANPTLTYTVGGLSLVNGDMLSGGLATAATARSDVGSYAIGQGTLAASANYAVTYQGADLTVTARPLSLTAQAQSRFYGDANPALTYAVGGQGLANGDALSGGLATVATSRSNVGAYAIGQGTLAASANYAVTYQGADLTVTARPLTLTAQAQGRLYGEVNPALTYAVGGRGLVNGDTLTGSLANAATARSDVGTYAIGQGTLVASANYAVTYQAADLTVVARPLILTADAHSRVYGDANPSLTYTTGGRGLANGDTLTGTLATAATTASDVGAYAIDQGTLAASANYAVTYQGADLTVTARPLTLTAQAQSRTYGETNPALTYTVGGQGLVNGDTLSGGLATAATARSDVGSYAIGQGALAASANYAVTYSGANLTITPRPLSLTAQAQSRTYGDANPALTYAVGGRGLANGDTLSGGLATVATSRSDIGTYAIGQGTLAASANYAVTYQGADLTVTARPLTLTAQAQGRLYGDANPALTYAVGGQGLANGDTLSGALATAATTASNVGAYAIGQGTLAASANYAVTYQGADLTVTARPLTLTAQAQSRTYGETNPALTYTVGGRGLANGDTLSGALATAATARSDVGAYAIGQGTLAASANYAVTYQGADLTVAARPLTLTAQAQNRLYGDANPALTYVVGGLGLVNGDTLSGGLATAATARSDVGSYAIGQGTLAASANYAVAYQGADLTVTARPLTLTAQAQSRFYGDANPALTYAVGGQGLANGDALSGGLATVATSRSNVGSYAIGQGTLAASANYAVTYQGADLTIAARPLRVTADDRSRIAGEANPALTYTVGNQGLVNGDTLTGALATMATAESAAGAYAITRGSLAVSPNYALTLVPGTLTVAPAPETAPVVAPTAPASAVFQAIQFNQSVSPPPTMTWQSPAPGASGSSFGDPRFDRPAACLVGAGSCFVAPPGPQANATQAAP
ncbi:filamentous hemagglutinin N-terminal domain-containing protein (plasmid) [Methylobacterium currus]|uniref:MBG domain-containing protein n=1 Tax=Methylobacterium currus TaxID=2051553 RepID=UPI001E5E43CF|nr:MBG domain-containing protein [Methylobacterium currus]UHC20203.1 filamentous hemagglutinin N-terminal domain-containing protein [Methylobacterium currus]